MAKEKPATAGDGRTVARPIAIDHHPLNNRTYRVATTAIEDCWLLVSRCLQYRIPGALIYGESRLGKTYAIEYLRMLIHRERPEIPTFHVQSEHKASRSEGAFFTRLLRSVRHPSPDSGRNGGKRRALHERLRDVAEAQGSTSVIFFCDEAQRYCLHEYEWLRDVHDELAQCGVRLTTFLFGQERLCEQRARFQESGDTHIVKRFMVETLRFRGIRSAVDAATCLRSYDEHAYPVGGQPEACGMPAPSVDLIARWLAFLRRRVTLPVLFDREGAIDAARCAGSVGADGIEVCIVPRPTRHRHTSTMRARWSAGMQHKCLELCYWRQANRLWRQCHGNARQWYRGVIRGRPFGAAPDPQALAFLYWRMTWQGCSNPYLLRRAYGLPLYIAEWEANQCARDDDEIDLTMLAFEDALAASWDDWLECIDLLGAAAVERHPWRLRATPGTFASFTASKKRRDIDRFVQSLRKSI